MYKAFLESIRASVESVNYYADRDPSFLFNLRPLSGMALSGTDQGILVDVPMLVPVFGPIRPNLQSSVTSASGLLGLPQVGSVVLVVRDNTGWLILGCLTGPVTTSDAQDSFHRNQSFNSGIEQAAPKTDKVLPGLKLKWMFGFKPGDIVMGNAESRLKVCGQGAVLGSPDCMSVYKPDGEILTRTLTYEYRHLGYMEKHAYQYGTGFEAWAAMDSSIASPPADGSVCNTYVYEVSPYPSNYAPFLIEQKGFISDVAANSARQAVDLALSANDAAMGLETTFRISREAVVEQFAPDPPQSLGNELKTTHFAHYTRQVWSDGSYSISSGNKAKAPGNTIFDCEINYSAADNKWSLTLLGAASIEVDGQTGNIDVTSLTGEITATSPKKITSKVLTTSAVLTPEKATVDSIKIELTAQAEIDLTAPIIKLSGDMVSIEGTATLDFKGANTSTTSTNLNVATTNLTFAAAGVSVAAAGGTMSVATAGPMSMTSTALAMTSPAMVMAGNMNIGGLLQVAGDVQAGGTPTSLVLHTHSNGNQGAPTGPPQ